MCISPLDGWYSNERNANGKRSIVFDIRSAYIDRPVTVPCGRCIECRLRRKRAWALRCEHEASLHDENCWLTLTYEDKHLPDNGSLRKSDLQGFLKRVRAYETIDAVKERRSERRFKFFACGEYGGRFDRPHYHVMLFGFDFRDKVTTTKRNEYQQFESESLDKRWGKGFAEIGTPSVDGYGYLAKYVTKRDRALEAELTAFGFEPEFLIMSRGGRMGKGLAYDWWKQYGDEVLEHDSCIMKGREVSVPAYYDALNEVSEPEKVKKVKAKRRQGFDEDESRTPRLMARKAVIEGGAKLFKGA